MAARERALVIFRAQGGRVSIDMDLAADNPFRERAADYLAFLNEAAALLPPDFAALFCICLNDVMDRHAEAPVMAFQRARWRDVVLVPDPDFFKYGWFEDQSYADPLPYDAKTITAVFAGSTSGRIFTAGDVEARALERFAAAAYFADTGDVDFRLPHIVQAADAAAHAAAAAQPFCQGPPLSWQEHYRHRFLLSLDGNGATCSRMWLALRSQSVPMKYESDHLLYYFHGLQPWVHYLPIGRHADVAKLIAIERRAPGTFHAVADAGQHVVRTLLTRERVTRYMAYLLEEYAACFADAPAPEPPAPTQPDAPRFLEALAHVQGVGDVRATANGWCGHPGNGRWIEAVTIVRTPAAHRLGVSLQALRRDGVLTPACLPGEYCGTEGRGLPLIGLCFRAQDSERLRMDVRFVGGAVLPGVRSGVLARDSVGAPVEAVRFRLPPPVPCA